MLSSHALHSSSAPPLRQAACTAPRRPACAAPRPALPLRTRPRTRAGPADNEDDRPPAASDDTARSFSQELKRRRVRVEDLAPKPAGGKQRPPAAPRWADGRGQDQRVLGNEGLEGLPRRGLELLRLGASAFLPFLPFMLVFSLLFTATFMVFGESFLHSGDYFTEAGLERSQQAKPEPTKRDAPQVMAPQIMPQDLPGYIMPEALLAEPTYDRMVPFREPPQ